MGVLGLSGVDIETWFDVGNILRAAGCGRLPA
jgi:hypothetical protein